MTVYAASMSDTMRVGLKAGDAAGWQAVAGKVAFASDSLIVRTNIIKPTWRLSGVLADKMLFRSMLIGPGIYNRTLADRRPIRLSDAVQRQLKITFASHLGLTDTMASVWTSRLRDMLAVSELLAPQAMFMLATADRVKIASLLSRGIGAMIVDRFGLNDLQTTLFHAVAVMQDALSLTSTTVPTLRAVVMETDAITIHEAEALRMIYQGMLIDGINCVADVAEPDGGITTWAMNARSGELTEYQNWSFNSFGKMGDVYLGASSDGLYELIGDADQETPIAVNIRGGTMELAGTHLTGFKSAYIAARGDGEFFLKLEGSGRSTTYRVQNRSMRTRKVDLGKGWRSRYMTWELISTGQDFDLTGLTFIPLTSMRRVS